jgi:hypothetical protein
MESATQHTRNRNSLLLVVPITWRSMANKGYTNTEHIIFWVLSFLLIFFRLDVVELRDDVDDVFIRLLCECLCSLCRCFSCAGIFSSPPGALSVPLPSSSFDYHLYGLRVSSTVISSPTLPYLLYSGRCADATRFYFHAKSRNLGVSRSKGWHL